MIFLAKDVALSVTISSSPTLVGVVATPLLTRLYVDAHIQVDVMGMLLSIQSIHRAGRLWSFRIAFLLADCLAIICCRRW